jgi:DNA-binding NarL/FixJ family response regulator
MPIRHFGKEYMNFIKGEDAILNRVIFDQLISELTDKERETILMWTKGNTLKEIAQHISLEYEGRTEDTILTTRTIGTRIKKIIKKLKGKIESTPDHSNDD